MICSFSLVILITLVCFVWIRGEIHQEENKANWVLKQTEKGTQNNLLLISFDGFRWNYLNGRAKTPNFDETKRNGVHAYKGLQGAFLTNTLPNHFTIVTGLHVESHGFIDNFMYDPVINQSFIPEYSDANYYNHPDWHATVGEPIWVTNQLQNERGRSGLIMWMGGETVIRGQRPSRYVPYNEDMTEKERVDTFMHWMTDLQEPINLGVVYFHQPDVHGHKYGPDSVEVTRKIEELDEIVGYIFQQLELNNLTETTDVIFTSDHGFLPAGKDKVVNLDEIIHPSWYTQASYLPGTIAAIWPNEGAEEMILNKLKTVSQDTGFFTVYRKSDIPERFHFKNHRRIPPIFALASAEYTFVTEKTKANNYLLGNHGYDNGFQDMRPFFIARGPSFRKGFEIETFPNVDLYGLMCHILKLRPAPNNGSMTVVSTLLRDSEKSDGSVYQLDFRTCISLVIIVVMAAIVILMYKVINRDKVKTR